jgi:DNA primase
VLAAHRIATDDAAAALLIRPESGRERLAGRIIFGERDRTGRVLHLIGRRFAPWLSPDAPKYLALSELTKPLYGYARLDRRPSAKPVFLVEGPPDQLTLNQWGHDALANLGTRLTPHHATLLAALRRPLVVVPNNDAESGAGLAAAEQWVTRIGHGQLLRLPADVKDVNEMAQQPRGWAQWAGLLAGLRVV